MIREIRKKKPAMVDKGNLKGVNNVPAHLFVGTNLLLGFVCSSMLKTFVDRKVVIVELLLK